MSDLVPATKAMLEQASGHVLRPTVQAIALVEGERLLGVAGIYPDRGRMVMFANMLEPMREHKRMVVRAYRRLMKWAGSRGLQVHAKAHPLISGSDTLLEHMGFRYLPHADLYVWNPNG